MIWGLLSVASVAAVYALVAGIGLSLLHIVFAVVRMARGRPSSGWRWEIAGRSLPVLAALILVPLLLHIEAPVKRLGVMAADLWSIALLAVVIAAMVLPFFLPLLEAWRERRASSYLLLAASLLSFPLIVGLTAALSAYAMRDLQIAPPSGPFVQASQLDSTRDRAYFDFNRDRGPCGLWIAQKLDLPDVPVTEKGWAGHQKDFVPHRWAFWFETAAESLTFDGVEIYRCRFSVLTHNSESLLMSTIVFIFRILYSALFFATLAVIGHEIYLRAVRASEDPS